VSVKHPRISRLHMMGRVVEPNGPSMTRARGGLRKGRSMGHWLLIIGESHLLFTSLCRTCAVMIINTRHFVQYNFGGSSLLIPVVLLLADQQNGNCRPGKMVAYPPHPRIATSANSKFNEYMSACRKSNRMSRYKRPSHRTLVAGSTGFPPIYKYTICRLAQY
jgi:hypothetical protein